MKKLQAIYPPFAAAFPVLAVFSANLSICPLSDLWRPLGIAVGAAILIWLATTLLWRNAARGAASAVVVIVALFLYGKLDTYCFVRGLSTLPIWAASTVAGAALAGWKWSWHRLLNVLSVFLVLSSVGAILVGYGRIARDEARVAPPVAAGSTGAAQRPDIYYVILDGYGRSDQLKRVMDFDDGPFLRALAQRGFYVAPGSHSNYVQTELSLGSSLNVNFIPDLLPAQPKNSDDRAPLDDLATHNAVARYLRSIGYEIVTVTTAFPALRFNDADLHLGRQHRVSLLESTLEAMTPIAVGGYAFDSAYDDRRQILNAAFSNLRTLGRTASVKPRFVIAHILAPHPPFVFNADGTATPRPRGSFGYWDGSDYYLAGNTRADYRNGYIALTKYVNAQTLSLLDSLLASPGPAPIVLLQGDHGSKLGLNQNSLEKTDIDECMSNLMAFDVPADVRAKLYPSITPVNSFRIILSTLFGADLPNLPDRSWYSTFDEPFAFTEVTSRLAERAPSEPPSPASSPSPAK
ncbi:MAG: hypothetical protein ACYC96_12985 [Fimbriimonadaceae bacterium]